MSDTLGSQHVSVNPMGGYGGRKRPLPPFEQAASAATRINPGDAISPRTPNQLIDAKGTKGRYAFTAREIQGHNAGNRR